MVTAESSAGRTIVVAVDHTIDAEALRGFLAATYEVVGVVHHGGRVVPAVIVLRPDLLVLDLELPTRHGFDPLPDLQRAAPETRIVVLTRTRADVVMSAALAKGTSAVVLKTAPLLDLARTIADVLRTGAPSRAAAVAAETAAGIGTPPPNWRLLTPRERDILALVGHGLTSAQIATLASVTERAVHFHRSNIRRKLGLHSDFELHRLAILAKLGY